MKVLLFGASGMLGQGVLRECLLAPDVELVQTVGRSPAGVAHDKLKDVVLKDMMHSEGIAASLQGFDACFFCLGVSSAGMSEARYTELTYELTMSIAQVLAPLNPAMTFIYVSGASTDSTEQGKSMWARVKGRTENALQRLPFKAVYLFRPGIIQPLNGAYSKTPLYNTIYKVLSPVLGTLRRWMPDKILSTESIGLAMLAVARHGAPKAILETRDISIAAGTISP